MPGGSPPPPARPADGGGALVLRRDDGGSGTRGRKGGVRAHTSRAQGWNQGGRVGTGWSTIRGQEGAERAWGSPGQPGAGGGGGGGGGHRGLIPRGRARRAKTERAQWSRDHQTNNTVLPPPSFGENGGRSTPTSSSSSSSLLFSRRRRRPLSQATDVVDLLRNAALRPAVVIPRNRSVPIADGSLASPAARRGAVLFEERSNARETRKRKRKSPGNASRAPDPDPEGPFRRRAPSPAAIASVARVSTPSHCTD